MLLYFKKRGWWWWCSISAARCTRSVASRALTTPFLSPPSSLAEKAPNLHIYTHTHTSYLLPPLTVFPTQTIAVSDGLSRSKLLPANNTDPSRNPTQDTEHHKRLGTT
ncbi:unnamed protein product, partial [Ectocarpus sp. 6 AP-2014]